MPQSVSGWRAIDRSGRQARGAAPAALFTVSPEGRNEGAALGQRLRLPGHSRGALELEPEEPQIVFDIPRPKRDDVVSPERAFVEKMVARRVTTPVEPDGYDGSTSDMDKST